MCYQRRKPKNSVKKPLCGPPNRNDPLVNKVRVQGYQKRSIKPNIPNVLEPSEFQLLTDFTESFLH